MEPRRAFANVIKSDEIERPLPTDAFLAELDAFIEQHNPYHQNEVIRAIGNGTASMEIVKRYAKELYYLGRWMTP